MVRIFDFDSVEDVFAELERDRTAADARVQPWQAELTHGDFFLRLYPIGQNQIVAIYGEILKPWEEDEELYNEPHMKHFRSTRCFSVMCPEGELGDVHVSTMGAKLSRTQFERARQMGWPSDSRVRQIVEME